jgi:hypothetical protein
MAVCINIMQPIPINIKCRLHILSMMKLPTMVNIKLCFYVSIDLARSVNGKRKARGLNITLKTCSPGLGSSVASS